MEIELTQAAANDLDYWKKNENETILKRIRQLLDSIMSTPYSGIGKPEPLRHQLAGKWSRRIDRANRLVYRLENQTIYVFSMRGHYETK